MTYQALSTQSTLPPLASVAFALAVTVLKWEQRKATRRALARLDEHLLADIGLNATAAETEGKKPFWQD